LAKEIAVFKQAIDRSSHFLFVYGLISNQRSRAIRSDWGGRLKEFMRWPKSTRILRVDGDCSMLIIKNGPKGLTYERFEHDYASEVLRSAIVSTVSSLDKYFHDRTLNRAFTLLNGPQKNVPKKLQKFEFPAVQAFKAVKKIRNDAKSRPGSQLKIALQNKLHSITFQNSHGINECCQLMGVKDFWRLVANEMEGEWSSNSVQTELQKVIVRRNQIVHEADLERKISSSRFALRHIDKKFAESSVEFIRNFVEAADLVIEQQMI